jgi:beta-glucosidase-like glycosyl hydrolase/CubicO group peptidase (beta-lactamase class C family)
MKILRWSVLITSILLSQLFYGLEADTLVTSETKITTRDTWVDSVLSSLSLDEQIAQLLMIRTYSNKDEAYYMEMEQLVEEHNLGGLCFFQGGPEMQAILTNRYQESARTPLLIAMDAEWGLGMRLDSTFSYPYQMTLGAGHDDTLLYRMGAEIALQLKTLGVHINFAPVVDINNNPDNPVINSRSFGENKFLVAEKASAYMKGMQDNGIIATAKHFPGHGDTDSDSHLTLPVIKHPKARLDTLELVPFKELIAQGLKGVMVAHLYIPSLDSTENRPTTLSRRVVTGLLKEELGFEGLVITDALDMKGVTSHYMPGEIEVKAFQAGNDILLLPQDAEIAIAGIRKAIEKGEIRQEEVTQRCRKILTYKYEAGLNAKKTVELDSLYEKVNKPTNELLARKCYEGSITVVSDENELIPLRILDTLNIASISFGSAELTSFQDMLSNYAPIRHFNALKSLTKNQTNNLVKNIAGYNLVIAGVHNTSIFPGRDFGISQDNLELLDRLADSTKVILVMFSSPYSLSLLADTADYAAILIAHQDNKLSNEIAAQIIMGSIDAKGRLPVSSLSYQAGSGLDAKAIGRLKYTLPEEVGIPRQELQIIDTIVLNSIQEKEMPGCQVLVAKDGKVIYRKSFGYHTYKKGSFVKETDVYDIASVTKVAATTLSIMRLYDQGKLDIDHKLSWYLPYLNGTNKEQIIIREMMAHQSRLKPWIPFYLNTMEHGRPAEEYYSRKLDEKHTVKVADGLFIRNDYSYILFDSIVYSDLRRNNDYKYSDLGFYLLKEAIENLTNKPLDSYVQDEFYEPLGLQYTGYLPLKQFKPVQIVPTEDDHYFRHQLIHGYVHDPGAAMLGGVAGHAGLFSNANDLAIFMQMLLNGGKYGGQAYILANTVKQFTSQQFPINENRRGIGFDKPDPLDWDKGPTCESASPNSFGHSGFTGTYVWADPEYDLVYIFLSNRIHPSASNTKLIRNNTRTLIHQVIYDALPRVESPDPIPEELGAIPMAR